jgi:hypothetical protein
MRLDGPCTELPIIACLCLDPLLQHLVDFRSSDKDGRS